MTSCFRKIDENKIVVCLKRLLVQPSTLKGYDGYEVDMDHLVGINQNWLITLPATRIFHIPFLSPRTLKVIPNFPAFSFGGILLMEEILHHLGCIKAYK